VNQPIPPKVFAVPKIDGVTSVPPEPLGEGYTGRFIKLHDGGDGNMHVRHGKEGPKGSNDGGFVEFN
jgi:hypothetical protein